MGPTLRRGGHHNAGILREVQGEEGRNGLTCVGTISRYKMSMFKAFSRFGKKQPRIRPKTPKGKPKPLDLTPLIIYGILLTVYVYVLDLLMKDEYHPIRKRSHLFFWH